MAKKKKPPVDLVARRITLVDDNGQMRALLDTRADGQVFFNLYGPNKAGLIACIDVDGNPKLCFINKQDQVVMSLGVSDDIGQGFSIADSEGRPVCFISVPADGVPQIRLVELTSPTRGKNLWTSPRPKRKRRGS